MHPPRDETHTRDLALLDALRADDHAALGTLIDLYSALLYRFAYIRTHDSQLAEDAVQDVFISLWDRRDQIELSGTLKNYLFQAVRYRVINAAQREHTQDRLKSALVHTGIQNTHNQGDESIEISEATHAVAAALAALPARAREIFMLRQRQQMDYVDIAAILNIGVPTVHNQMSRATHAIRVALEKWRSGK